MFNYQAYGRVLSSNRPLAPFYPSDAQATVFVELRDSWPETLPRPTDDGWQILDVPISREGEGGTEIPVSHRQLVRGTQHFLWHKWETENGPMSFVIDHAAAKITGIFNDSIEPGDWQSFFATAILGAFLRSSGTPCIHACVIAVQDRALAIIGTKRAGKSTTATAFAQHGYAIMADDIGALERGEGDRFLAHAAYPGVRLWRRSVKALLDTSADGMTKVFSALDKRYLKLEATPDAAFRFHPGTLPLGAIYCLESTHQEEGVPTIEPLQPKDALLKLLSQSYGRHFASPKQKAEELAFFASLLRVVPCKLVRRPASLEKIPLLITALTQDFATTGTRDLR